MQRLTFLILFSLMVTFGLSQTNDQPKLSWKYGIAGGLTVPKLSDNFDPTVGWTAEIFAAYTRNNNTFYSTIGSRNLTYKNPDLFTTVQAQDLLMSFGLKSNFGKLTQTYLLIEYCPSSMWSAKQTYFGSDKQIPKTTSVLSAYSNVFSQAISVGFDLELNHFSHLELKYSIPIKSKSNPYFVDAIPPQLRLSYAINFNRFVTKKDPKTIMVESLTALQNDTLYIINRGCPSDFRPKQLDSLWNTHFTFSPYKIIEDHEISKIQQYPNCIHFAVIGSYYAATNEPLSSGIFLLDKELKNTVYPYPVFTKIYGGRSTCFESLADVSAGIITFNKRLISKLRR